MTATFYPLGHPVEITSNSLIVFETAAHKWRGSAPRFAAAPLRFCIEVSAGSEIETRVEYEICPDGFQLLGERGGRARFSVDDATGSAQLSAGTVASNGFWSNYLRPLVITALDWTCFLPVHAGCVMRGEKAVLLCGDSGSGKSTLSYACARLGWTFVSDDAMHWATAEGVMIPGSNSISLREPSRQLFPEIATLPLRVMDNGKFAMEVCPQAMGWRQAPEAPLGSMVFLDRHAGAAHVERVDEDVARTYLHRYSPRRGGDYNRLLEQGVWRLRYETLADAVVALEQFG